MNDRDFERLVTQLESILCSFCGASLTAKEFVIIKSLLDEATLLALTHRDLDPYEEAASIMAKEIADTIDAEVLADIIEEAETINAFDRAKDTIK